MKSDKINLIGFNREELIEELVHKNIITEKEKYRVKQLWHWIYFQGISNSSEMTTFSSEFQNNENHVDFILESALKEASLKQQDLGYCIECNAPATIECAHH